MGFPVAKNPSANVGDPRDMGLIPESRRSPEKEMETHYSILAWKISWREKTGGPQSIGSQSWT